MVSVWFQCLLEWFQCPGHQRPILALSESGIVVHLVVCFMRSALCISELPPGVVSTVEILLLSVAVLVQAWRLVRCCWNGSAMWCVAHDAIGVEGGCAHGQAGCF